jgi:HTH domain
LLGPNDAVLRARCLAIEAEIALLVGDLRWSEAPVARAINELQAAGDERNASYLRLVAARAALRLGRPLEAEQLLGQVKMVTTPLQRTLAELVKVELAAKRAQPNQLILAIRSATAAAEQTAIAALIAEVAQIRDHFEGPSTVVLSRGKSRTASFCDVCTLACSESVVIDGSERELRLGSTSVSFARKPVLFELLRVLAETAPDATPRDLLMRRVFEVRRANDSHRSRLRVELGRLRKMVTPHLNVHAKDAGYALSANRDILLVLPLAESPASRLLALMRSGDAWSAASLALALNVSERTVQRQLVELEREGSVGPLGKGRARRWVRLLQIPTDLLLPTATRES